MVEKPVVVECLDKSRSRTRRRSWSLLILKLATTALLFENSVSAFVTTAPSSQPTFQWRANKDRSFILWAASGNSHDGALFGSEHLYLERFKRRRMEVEIRTKKEEERQPPNPALSPTEFVTAILGGLRNPNRPAALFGLKLLLRSSTSKWQTVLSRSVGAPLDVGEDTVCAALETAFSRDNNQFRILVDPECKNEEYLMDFPSDPLDYEDGTCWVECRLRGKQDDALLVALGWSLVQRKSDLAWLVDAIDWQDFRESYRPGIGREEWERICG